MHEMSLCENLLDILNQQAERERFRRVKRVCLEVGPFSCVEPDALRFGFGVVMRGSLAEGAELDIAQSEAKALCLNCFESVTVQKRFDTCPLCGGQELQVTSGDELRIKQLEVM